MNSFRGGWLEVSARALCFLSGFGLMFCAVCVADPLMMALTVLVGALGVFAALLPNPIN